MSWHRRGWRITEKGLWVRGPFIYQFNSWHGLKAVLIWELCLSPRPFTQTCMSIYVLEAESQDNRHGVGQLAWTAGGEKRRASTAMAATPFSSFIRSWWLVGGQRVFWGLVRGETGILSRGLCFEERGVSEGCLGRAWILVPKRLWIVRKVGWGEKSRAVCHAVPLPAISLLSITPPPPPWVPTLLGMASITSESSITGQKWPEACKWL